MSGGQCRVVGPVVALDHVLPFLTFISFSKLDRIRSTSEENYGRLLAFNDGGIIQLGNRCRRQWLLVAVRDWISL